YYQIGILKYRLGQFDETIDYMNQVIELDPLFTSGYNILSYSFGKIGQFDKAIEASDKFIFLSPNEPNPYDSRGDIYAMFKMYDEAIESYKKALEKKDDFYASWSSLGNVYTFTGDFIEAERCFKVIASVEDIYIWTNGKVLLGHNLMYQGKFIEALKMLEIGSNEDKKAHGEKMYATYHNLPALMYEELGDYDKALDELEKADTISQKNANYSIYWRQYKTRIVANSGEINWALSNADTLKTGLEEAGLELGEYWYSLGTVELAQNNFTKAEGYFRKAISEIGTYDYSSNYMLGLTLFNMDRIDESIAQFEGLLAAQDSLPATWNSWDARVYYYLGILYDNTGQLDNAA
ncbi:MAG: tetratricopeptide repeat protein, partial [candidate division Zixibacteria bacterium]|nr:tetratricopeptide repeat protein [candidate division Zixibacteria bacterium]